MTGLLTLLGAVHWLWQARRVCGHTDTKSDFRHFRPFRKIKEKDKKKNIAKIAKPP